jgi:hypothetical protein
MILTTEKQKFLSSCIGSGPLDKASYVLFGNELGTASGKTPERTIEKFENDWKENVLKIGDGFSSLHIDTPPVNSTFLQFFSRLVLALKYNDERFLGELSFKGKTFLYNFIVNELYRYDTAVINLRPYPQSTERTWEYTNINEKEYYKSYNFSLRRSSSDSLRDCRFEILKNAFELAKNSLILGSGDKHNKKAFLEKIYPKIKLETVKLETIEIYFSEYPKIILSNYYDNRNGIKIKGLQEIYKFINR